MLFFILDIINIVIINVLFMIIYFVYFKKHVKRNKKQLEKEALYPLRIIMTEYNNKVIATAKESGKDVLLYVLDEINAVGGVETRLHKMFSYLEKTYEIIIITSKNENYNLQKYKTLTIDFTSKYYINDLKKIIKDIKPKNIEFQCKELIILKNLKKEDLQDVRSGITFHGKVKQMNNISNIDIFDYKITVSDLLSKFVKFDSYVIENCMDIKKHTQDLNVKTGKALFISRLVSEKKYTIVNFVNYCRKNNIQFDIAGSLDSPKMKKMLLKEYNISPECFIGEINSEEFLEKNSHKYDFIGGIGQVALEAIANNKPVFVAAHALNVPSTFLVSNNFDILKEHNFTCKNKSMLKQSQICLDINEAKADIENVKSKLSNLLNIDLIMNKYKDIINIK